MRLSLAALRSVRKLTMPAMILGTLFATIGPSDASEEASSDAPCPADFTCVKPYPRDGACRHPAIILEEKTKSGGYESDPYSRVFEKACIPKTGALATRRGGELRLTLGNGAVKLYKDNQNKKACAKGPYESCKSYMLYDYFPGPRFFLVHVLYYESDEWILVRQQDGKEEGIVAPPRYSPSKKWLASVFWTEGPSDGNNGIDIVPANGDSTEAAFHYRPKDYELWEFVGWEGDDRLLVKVTSHAGSDPDFVTKPAEVVRVNGKWQLNRLPPEPTRP